MLRTILLGAVLAAGLAGAAPARARTHVIPLSAEIGVGREAARYVEEEFPLSNDPLLTARVQRIGRRVAGVSDRPDLPFEFHVIDTPDINAFALPGGFVYVFRGLLQGVPDDDALAFVIAHEVAHAVRRHSLDLFEKSQILRIVTAPLGRAIGSLGRDLANVLIQKHFSRKDEAEADRYGLLYAVRAGFAPDSGVRGMQMLLTLGGRGRFPEFLADHPDMGSRKRTMAALAEKMKKSLASQDGPAMASLPEPQWDLPPFSPEANALFPLAVGSAWTYRIATEAGRTMTATTRVVEEQPEEPRGLYRLETTYEGGFVAASWAATTAARAHFRPAGREGEGAWRVEWPFGAGEASAAPAAETVTVPAGRFACTRVRRLAADGSVAAEGWFAEGVGLVKCVWPARGLTQELLRLSLAGRG